jgi:hypothetical protein
MANEPEKKIEKVELTFGEQMMAQGWTGCHISQKIERLNNPDPQRTTLGFRNSLGNKQTAVDAPTEEWLRVLTEVAKKAAKI